MSSRVLDDLDEVQIPFPSHEAEIMQQLVVCA
jgi:hypothetical protein